MRVQGFLLSIAIIFNFVTGSPIQLPRDDTDMAQRLQKRSGILLDVATYGFIPGVVAVGVAGNRYSWRKVVRNAPGTYFYSTSLKGRNSVPHLLSDYVSLDPGEIDSLGVDEERKKALHAAYDRLRKQGHMVTGIITTTGGGVHFQVVNGNNVPLRQLRKDARMLSSGETTWEKVLNHRAPKDELAQDKLRKISES